MKLKDLFTRKRVERSTAESVVPARVTVAAKLDLDLLDDCVGGRADGEGVGCYVRSTQPTVH